MKPLHGVSSAASDTVKAGFASRRFRRLAKFVFAFCLLAHGQGRAEEVAAQPTLEFLESIGVVSSGADRGQPLAETVKMLRYGGFRWLRTGIEGMTDDGPLTIKTFLRLHKETGVKIGWGLGSGGNDLDTLLKTGRILAKAGALLAFEGNNEPNNWPVIYKGREGGGSGSWLPLAELQAELYRRVKSDPLLVAYPVWSLSEPGAQTDNAGLQFLEIPPDAGTLMPAGTRYADYANVHNYLYHPNAPHPADNKSWDASEPGSASRVDGLYGNFSNTWANHYRGYAESDLARLPRVTTETGVVVGGEVSEALQAYNLVNLYLAQFKRGYAYTSVYLLRDRTDEEGLQTFGFFRPDYSPRIAARYLHNLTRILADDRARAVMGRLDYTIEPRYDTVHDLLLQRSDGVFQLVLWGETLKGEKTVTVRLKRRAARVGVFDPTVGTAPLAKHRGVSEVVITLANHPVILTIR